MPERQGKESIWQQRSPRTPRDHQHPHDHKGHQGHHREKGSGADLSGELTYDEKVIQKIIGLALCEIPGLLTVDGGFFSNMAEKLVNTDNVSAGIEAEVGKKQVAVDMDVVVEYGYDIENIFSDMKDLIRDEVKQMTHLDVIEVNVNVVDIKTREEYQKDADTIQDKMGRAAEKTGDFAGRQTDKAKRSINRGADKARESQRPRVE
ncbi:Asp23/Gls24 family envelope stress response protein [Enterococcus timonensis]|uniref:Asp23/Gls24 family envelope stress response protein n=1 Tax=Enterococcus timonensis TaxID=1852364 RepID=UPI0009F5E9FF